LALMMDGDWRVAVRDEEARYYVAIVLFCVVFTTGILNYSGLGLGQSFRESIFTIVSIGTSTGYVNNDYTGTPWPTVSLFILLFLMVMGASAGSTSGGLKVLRFNLAIKVTWRELTRIANPRQVKVIRMNKDPIEEDFISLIVGMLLLWMGLFILSSLIMSMLLPGRDFETIISVVASSLGNTGPALGSYGSTNTWASMSTPALLWSTILMWFGRLELLTALILLHPRTWRSEEKTEEKLTRRAMKAFKDLFGKED